MGHVSLQPLRTHTKPMVCRLTTTPLDLALISFALSRRHFLGTSPWPNQYHEASGSQNTLAAVHRAKRPWGLLAFALTAFCFGETRYVAHTFL